MSATGDEHRTRRVGGVVQHERLVTAPCGEESVLEAGSGDPLEIDGRDDLVGVDVAAPQRDSDTGVLGELLHELLLVQSCRQLTPSGSGRTGWTACRARRWRPRPAD